MSHETPVFETLPALSSSEFNKGDLERYFQFIGAENEIFTGCFLTADGASPQSGFGVVHGSSEEMIAQAYITYSETKATLHVCLNRTNLRGRKIKDMQACRVLCVDIDEPTERGIIRSYVDKYRVQMVVESSPGKFHLYWKLSATVPLPQWSNIQRTLALIFNGDRNLQQINKTIRAPGIQRATKDGTKFMPRIVYLSETAEELEDIIAVRNLFPDFDKWLDKSEKEETKRMRTLKRALKTGDFTKLGKSAGEGSGRNCTLYEAVRERVAETGMPHEVALQLGESINKQFASGLDAAEVVKTVESAWNHGIERFEYKAQEIAAREKELRNLLVDRVLTESENLNGTNGHHAAAFAKESKEFVYDYDGDPFLSRNRFTDMATRSRFIQRFGKQLLHVGNRLFAFSERTKTWSLQDNSSYKELSAFYLTVVLDIIRDPQFVTEQCLGANGQFSETMRKRAESRFLGVRIPKAMINLVMNSEEIEDVKADAFDAVPELVSCSTGVLDMKKGTVRAAEASDYLLKNTPIAYSPDAKCDWWVGFLAEIFAENENPAAMVSFMQEVFGYSLSGDISAQKIFCHYGDGSNGKSKVLQALALISGDYSTCIDPDDLARNKTGFNKPLERIGAKIEGYRVAIIDDISTQTVWNESFVKGVTGPHMRARGEYERSRVISNRAKVHLGLNNAPVPESENYGMLRRLCIIPYMRQFEPDEELSNFIDAKIQEEAPGILTWAVKGYQRLEGKGISYPPELTTAIQAYKEDHFSIETVLGDLFEVSRETPPNFEFVTDLLSDVNTRLQQDGSFKQITTEELVHGIRRKFKLNFEKKWNGKRKNSFRAFRLNLKFNRKDETSII